MGQIKVEYNVDGIAGLCVITPAVHGDSRGYFMETYNANDMREAGLDILFVQDNQSMSSKGVLRGLHFQKRFPQAKLVRAIKGEVFDVVVDLRLADLRKVARGDPKRGEQEAVSGAPRLCARLSGAVGRG